MDVEALGTIPSTENMTFKTLGKSLPRPLNQQPVFRCFEFSFFSNPINLFGGKFESESILSIIVKVTGLSVGERDGLHRIVTGLSNFVSDFSHQT